MRNNRIDAPQFRKEMVLDEEWGEKVRCFLRKTKIGSRADIKTDDMTDEKHDESSVSDEDEFDVGTFE